ncbi:oligosaccharide repeat unit polymerase [Pseudomonas sp. SK2]|uniref:oligosaccharide repeat unit polymerase n=1 Tax=Pseudomonas sp. SK2 TaxID=2841063 RepID=UPI00192B8C21|nr:oligosaccharide repeat unit polymerase [Pseudomonas sp. SK2]QQZ37594.1 oligosaccharide repeat unit polymerase [Pseudomonas sp. SK2]
MIVSPFVVLMLLYFFANFVSLVFAVNDDGMFLEGKFFQLSSETLICSFALQVFFLLLLWLVYRLFLDRGVSFHRELGRAYGVFLFWLQLAFLTFNQISGVNVAGVDSQGGGGVSYLFIFLQPDILFILIGLGLKSNRLFWLNCIVFLLSMLLRGWMGGVFLVLVMLMCRGYPIYISLRMLSKGVCGLLILFALLPVFIEAKWAMRSGLSVSDFFTSILSMSFESYGEAVKYVMNRFQHVGHVALIIENCNRLHSSYLNGEFVSYWADGLPQMVVFKAFGLEYIRLNSFLVADTLGYTDAYWNTNPGLAGWAAILQEYVVLLLAYVVCLLVVVYSFMQRFAGPRYVMLISCFSLVYLFHGWIGAFFNLCFYAIMLMFWVRLRFLPRSNKKVLKEAML